MIGKQYARVLARSLTEQLPQALPGIPYRRRRGLRYRIVVETQIGARIVRRVHQRDHRLDRPRFGRCL